MATIDQIRPAGSNPFAALMGAMSSIVAWNDKRATRKSLSRLTDRELDDIGLMRGDIESM